VRIDFGPGRHPTSGAVFLYFAGPDGMVYEYSTGVRLIKPDEEPGYRPRQFAFAPESFCMRGSRPDIAEFRTYGQERAVTLLLARSSFRVRQTSSSASSFARALSRSSDSASRKSDRRFDLTIV
jgi:hypothetical protein